MIELLVGQLVGGLSYGMTIYLVASGLSLIFGVQRILNFAHGSFYMLGAFLCYTIVSAINSTGSAFWIALVLAPTVVALLAGLIEVTILRRIYHRDHLLQLLLTYAFILIISDAVKLIWGRAYRSVDRPDILSGFFTLNDVIVPKYNVFIIVVACAVMFLLWAFVRLTTIGKIVEAGAADPEMVGALGINLPRLFTLVFMAGSWLGGLGGAIIAPISAAAVGMDTPVIIVAFAVVIIGGLGSMIGTMIGSLIVGIVQAFGGFVFPDASLAMIFLVVIFVLRLRPAGLFGSVGST